VFENRVLGRIFGLKMEEAVGGWRKLHKEELHNLYSLSSIIRMIKTRRMRWGGHVACMRRRRIHIGFQWESPKERDLGRLRSRSEDNIKMDLRETGWGGMDWINLVQDRDQQRALVNMVMNLKVP
jgi:hypothetical protein